MGATPTATGSRTLQVGGLGSFLIDATHGIAVDREPGADEAEVEAILLGSAAAVLRQLRRQLPLHVAAVSVRGRAVAVAGPAGTGKSSLAAALVDRGHRLVTDDLAAVRYDERERALLVPGPPLLRMWGDSARQLGWPTDDRHRIKSDLDKYRYDIAERSVDGPRPLAAVYVLTEQQVPEVAIRAVSGFEKFEVLHRGVTYDYEFLDTPELRTWHFRQICRLAGAVPLFLVARPPGHWDVGEVATHIERHLAQRKVA